MNDTTDEQGPDLAMTYAAMQSGASLSDILFPSEESQIAETLSLIRRIVSSGWDREWASDEHGNQVEEWRDDAVNFNLLAAVLRAGYILEDVMDIMVHQKAATLVFSEIREQAGCAEMNIHDWQTAPERTKEDVLKVIDNALGNMKAGSDGR